MRQAFKKGIWSHTVHMFWSVLHWNHLQIKMLSSSFLNTFIREGNVLDSLDSLPPKKMSCRWGGKSPGVQNADVPASVTALVSTYVLFKTQRYLSGPWHPQQREHEQVWMLGSPCWEGREQPFNLHFSHEPFGIFSSVVRQNVLLFISPPPWMMTVGPRCQTVEHNCLLMVTSGLLASFFLSFFFFPQWINDSLELGNNGALSPNIFGPGLFQIH